MLFLKPFEEEYLEEFIENNQKAFNKAVVEYNPVFKGNCISRKTIVKSINDPDNLTFIVCKDGEHVGGVIVKINEQTNVNELEIFYINVEHHNEGLGYLVWCMIEAMFPQTIKWVTLTPYFEIRNLHFYINKCGFHMVEFFNEHHKEQFEPDNEEYETEDDGTPSEFCRFEKVMKSLD